MRVLVTGVCGQLGFDVMNELAGRGIEAVGSGHSDEYAARFTEFPIDHMPYYKMDITDPAEVRAVIGEVSPDAVIHCAAWTQVDRAETERERCFLVNSFGTENIAGMCKELDIPIMYFSTDYVFNGSGTRPWTVDDTRDPVDVYGSSKAEGEMAVERLTDKHFIVRTSWVFGLNGRNFIKTMIGLSKRTDEIKVVNDQFGNPTYTKDLAVLVADMITTDRYGVYHASNEGEAVSWFEFARAIFKAADISGIHVLPVSSGEYAAPAKRPSNSRLDRSSIPENGFRLLPTWEDALRRYIGELREQGEI